MINKLRGKELDRALKVLLGEMIADGIKNNPISRSNIAKVLNLKSRSTICGERYEWIKEAIDKQRVNAGLKPKDSGDIRDKRDVIIDKLKNENEDLKKQINALSNQIAEIVYGCELRGIEVKEVTVPL